MKTWVRKSLSVGVLAAGAVLFGQAAAHADVSTSGNFGIGNGLQVIAPVQTVADVCGNATSAAGGVSFADCTGGASGTIGEGVGSLTTSDNYGIGNGAQLYAPVQNIISTCGNSISGVGGVSFASCEGGAGGTIGGEDGGDGGPSGGYESTRVEKAGKKAHKADRQASRAAFSSMMTSGNFGILNGTQVYAPVQTVISLCGNSISGAGGVAFAGCEGGAGASLGSGEGAGELSTSDNYGIGNGTQLVAPIQTVTDISGNAVAAAGGVAFADSTGGASANQESTEATRANRANRVARAIGSLTTSNNYGIGNGIQVVAPIQTVTDISGNAVSAVGGVAFADSTGGASGTL